MIIWNSCLIENINYSQSFGEIVSLKIKPMKSKKRLYFFAVSILLILLLYQGRYVIIKTPIEKGKTHVKKRTELRNLVKMICSKKKDKTCSKLLKRKLKERCMKKYQLIDSLDSLNCKLKSIEKMQFQQQVIQNEMKI